MSRLSKTLKHLIKNNRKIWTCLVLWLLDAGIQSMRHLRLLPQSKMKKTGIRLKWFNNCWSLMEKVLNLNFFQFCPKLHIIVALCFLWPLITVSLGIQNYLLLYLWKWTSLVAQTVKRLSVMQETRVRSLGWEDPLEKEMAIHSSIAWKIPWTEEPGRLQSMGSQRVGHDWVTSRSLLVKM